MEDRSFLRLFGMDGLLHLHSLKKGGAGRIGRKKQKSYKDTKNPGVEIMKNRHSSIQYLEIGQLALMTARLLLQW